jgi:NAD(P)H-dependent flavin oxidoreductase YrpB (nitropropane dioxygenase family)
MSMLRTPICDMFDIEVPIFAAGMGGVTLAPLAGAVSAAGGLGTLGATFHTPDALRQEIRAVRRITDRISLPICCPKSRSCMANRRRR